MKSKHVKCLCIVSRYHNIDIIKYYNKFNLELYFLTPIMPDEKIFGVNYILDNDILEYNKFNFDNTDRPNWYYQQFLKFAVVMKLPYEYVHIIDGDSYLEENAIYSLNKLYYSSKMINMNYCNFNIFFGLTTIKKNFIVNHLNFHRDTLIKMFNDVFISWENILLNINSKTWLSEYYSFANYLIESKNDVVIEKVKVFRRGDLLKKSCLNGLGKNYHLIAFEPQHSSNLLKKILVRLFFLFKLNLG